MKKGRDISFSVVSEDIWKRKIIREPRRHYVQDIKSICFYTSQTGALSGGHGLRVVQESLLDVVLKDFGLPARNHPSVESAAAIDAECLNSPFRTDPLAAKDKLDRAAATPAVGAKWARSAEMTGASPKSLTYRRGCDQGLPASDGQTC